MWGKGASHENLRIGHQFGKTVFHLVGLDSSGQVVVRKRCSRTQLFAFTGNLQVQLIGMDACCGVDFLGKTLRAQGHDVRLMPAQYVKPCVKTNKSEYVEAEAIAEAVQRPRMRFADQDGLASCSRPASPPLLGLDLSTVALLLEAVHHRIACWCSDSRKQKTVQIRTTLCPRVTPLYALGVCGDRYWGHTE